MKNSFKNTLSVFLAAVMIVLSCVSIGLAAWDGSTTTEPVLKDGVYQISDGNELAWLAKEVNNGNNSICAQLTDDIDLGQTKWFQIGNADYSFNGTFDGNGKTVIFSMTKHTAIYAGLFRAIGSTGVVRNLTTGGVITVNTAKNYHGGIAGLNNGTIANCTNNVSLGTSSTKRVTYVGGIVGKNTGLVENCVNNASIDVTSYAGGIVGENNGGSVKGCENNGTVTSTNIAGYSGGIIAAVTANASDNKMSVVNCTNNGKVAGGSGDYGYAGGIIAQENVATSYNNYGSQPTLKIEGCVNNGELTGGNTENILAKQGKNCTIEIVEKSEPSKEDVEYVTAAAKALDDSWFKLCPTYGIDKNVNDIVKAKLASLGYGDANVSIKSSGDETCIAPDGSITYFYADPDSYRPLWFNSVEVVFEVEKGGATAEYTVNAVVHWDREKVESYLSENIISKVTYDAILGENEDKNEVTKNLVLPKVVDDKKFTLITWESSDPAAIKIDSSKQNTADTLFEPYIGLVKPGAEDKEVRLTATFTFQRTASYGEEEIAMTKEFTVVVKALSFETKKQMQKILDENYTLDKLKSFGSEKAIDPENVCSDIQLVIPSKTGIENYDSYKFTVSSSDSDTIKINSYRAVVYQPLPGEDAKNVDITVTMSSKEYNISVSKTFTLTVSPLEQAEIDREIDLMNMTVEHYFDGINNGANTDKNNITENLSSFVEAVFDKDGALCWIYDVRDMEENSGIVPVSIDLSHPSEYWDRFFTTDNDVITYENLLVTRASADKTVTITSCLSSNRFEKYALMYPENSDFQKLCRVPVSVTVRVLADDNKQDENGLIVADREIKDGSVIAKTKWFGKAVINLQCKTEPGAKVIWSSSNNEISVDSTGRVSYEGRKSSSGYITATIVGENDVVLSVSRLKVNFEKPKFNLIDYFKDFFEHLVSMIKNIF